jgi:hypothetical protein
MLLFGFAVAGPLLTIETSAWAPATAMVQLWVALFGTESVTWTVYEKGLPVVVVGVPVTAPVEPFRAFKPVGSDPAVIEYNV